MNTKEKLKCTGLFPTYLNWSSSAAKFQVNVGVSAPLVDFSSCISTYVAMREVIPEQQRVIYR